MSKSCSFKQKLVVAALVGALPLLANATEITLSSDNAVTLEGNLADTITVNYGNSQKKGSQFWNNFWIWNA